MTEQSHDHDVAAAWSALRGTAEAPSRIELLRSSRDTSVYRLHWQHFTIIGKRCPATTARIEKTVYEQILPALSLPVLRYFGSTPANDAAFEWLFVEQAQGREYRPDRASDRAAAARWLAAVHAEIARLGLSGCLPARRPEHYAQLLANAQGSLMCLDRDSQPSPAGAQARTVLIGHCQQLSARWSELADACTLGPDTLVHGDLVAHNARLVAASSDPVFVPFDWEKAGWGTPAEDLANVDLRAYRESLGNRWPELREPELRRLAGAGRVFRCLVFLEWLKPEIDAGTDRSAEQLDVCRSWLDAIMERSPWLA